MAYLWRAGPPRKFYIWTPMMTDASTVWGTRRLGIDGFGVGHDRRLILTPRMSSKQLRMDTLSSHVMILRLDHLCQHPMLTLRRSILS